MRGGGCHFLVQQFVLCPTDIYLMAGLNSLGTAQYMNSYFELKLKLDMNYDHYPDVCQDVLVHDEDEPEEVAVVLPGVIPGRCTRVVVVVWCSLPTVSQSDCVWLYTDMCIRDNIAEVMDNCFVYLMKSFEIANGITFKEV